MQKTVRTSQHIVRLKILIFILTRLVRSRQIGRSMRRSDWPQMPVSDRPADYQSCYGKSLKAGDTINDNLTHVMFKPSNPDGA